MKLTHWFPFGPWVITSHLDFLCISGFDRIGVGLQKSHHRVVRVHVRFGPVTHARFGSDTFPGSVRRATILWVRVLLPHAVRFGDSEAVRFGYPIAWMSLSPSRQHQFGSCIALGSVRNMVSMLLFLPLQSSLFLPIPRYAPPIRPGLPCCLFTSCSRKYHAPVRFGYVRSDPLPDPIPYPIRSGSLQYFLQLF